MIVDLFTNPLSFFIWAAALLIAITVHEFAHAWMADYLGDPTARLNGRLSLNPLNHLDPVGTLMIFLTRFGWGKPVPVDPYNLENPRRDYALISLAGPASNLILATILSVFLKTTSASIVIPIIILNVYLAIFNLLPLPPLDGSKILLGFLPEEISSVWEGFFNQYGLIILVLFLLPFSGRSLIISFLSPIVNFLLDLLL